MTSRIREIFHQDKGKMKIITGRWQINMHSVMCTVATLVLCCMLPCTLFAATYYVDASNPNVGDGSFGNPWKNLSSVNNYPFDPGDEIFFKRGETWHSWLWIKRSGTAGNPIVFGAYGDTNDPLPILDGTYSGSIQWGSVQGNIYKISQPASWINDPGVLFYNGTPTPSISTLEFSSSVSGVKKGAILLHASGGYCNLWVTSVDEVNRRISGITFFRNTGHWINSVAVRQLDEAGHEVNPYLNLPAPTNGLQVNIESLTQPGHWYWDENDESLYLYSDVDPNLISIEVGQLQWGFVALNQQYLTVRDLSIRGFKEVGTYFFRCNGIRVQNVHIYGTGVNGHKTGILVLESSNNTITGNTVDSVLTNGIAIYSEINNSHNNTVSANTIRNSGSAAISLGTGGNHDYVSGNIIMGNTITGANYLSYDAAGIYTLFTGSNTIQSNTIRNGGTVELRSAGIMVDQGCEPMTIEYNTIENNSLGGIALTGAGHQIKRNTLRNNGVSSWDCAQIVFFPVLENASNCTVEHNTMQAGNSQKLFMKVMNPSWGEPSHHIDYNRYRSESTAPFCWSNTWDCNEWIDFDAWKSQSGQDEHSTFNQPLALNAIYLLLLKN